MKFRQKTKPSLGIEITPLIDVVFLLLIFFMISTTFVAQPGIQVDLPQASARPDAQKPESLDLTLTKEHRIYLNGQELAPDQLLARLKAAPGGKDRSLVIRADGLAQHRMVVFVMDQAHQAGIGKLSVATIERER
ncbi:MAG: biopolymer transporter ExbD [bacterium]|nr:biopolymer transporter ExbD [bacterium]